jgi:prevent-host-death family protein
MRVAVSEAKATLTELVRRAEAGEEVLLTRHGKPAVRLVPVPPERTIEERRQALLDIRHRAQAFRLANPDVTSNHDFLYGEDGLPA